MVTYLLVYAAVAAVLFVRSTLTRWLLALLLLALALATSCGAPAVPTPDEECVATRLRYPPKVGGWCDCDCDLGACREGFLCLEAAPPDGGGLTLGCDWYAVTPEQAQSPRCSP